MFQSHQPVSGQAFHDRESELVRLQSLVDDLRRGTPHWLAIIGPRKIGKTSLILELSRRAGDVAVVALDTQEVSPLSQEFFRLYALRAADVLLGKDLAASLEVTAATGGDLDALLEASPTFATLPASVRTTIRSLGRAEMSGDFARVCLDLPDRMAQALGRRVLIAVDEFQDLAILSAQKTGDPLPLIRSVWQRHKHAGYIVSGSGRSMLEDMVSREHSPFFQHFSLLYLGAFAVDDAVALLTIEGPLGRSIPVEIARRAVEILGGNPFYLQLLGEALTAGDPPYDDASLKEALQELLFATNGRLALYFELQHERLVGRSTYLSAVLGALADGPKRLVDLAGAIETRSADASRYLERLGDAVWRRDDDRYELEDRVFGLWLRWRRPGGAAVPMTVIGDAAEREVAELLARSGFDLVYQSRASRGSFDLLATRGPHQIGIQVKRSPLPLRFERPVWQRMAADAKRFGWRWVVASVDADGHVRFLDPGKAKSGREIRLGDSAVIESIVEWLER